MSRSVLNGHQPWHLFFSTFTPLTCQLVSRKCACADDLAIMHASGDWQAVLTKDMATINRYLQSWKIKLNTTKMMSAVFHFNSKEAKRELKVNFNDKTLPFCSEPKYLGGTFDRTFMRVADISSHFAKSWHQASHS